MAVSNDHKEKLEFIEEMTKNTDQVQAKVLTEILSKNAETEYLKRYIFSHCSFLHANLLSSTVILLIV